MTSTVRLSRARRSLYFGAAALMVLACGREPAAPTLRTGGDVAFAKAAGRGPTLSSTSPAYGDQGTTIDVHVLGNGFGPDAQARWLLHGVANPNHVRTNRTTYVSPSEVIANITIAPDAQID